MDFLFDPTIWVGLITLVILEIVLGIDNLVFIAILAKKLPVAQQDKAIYVGLGLALLMRLFLLTIMSWLVTLTTPLFSLGPLSLSARDLILMVGGLFLLFKATMELHERLEARPHTDSSNAVSASFWLVITQILLLDAVFSLDSIITAVGMVDDLGVMMTAVIVAMIVMVVASKPLTQFVNSHPTVVVLCLSFLLMIGFSLVAEGLGFHIPKGYLYAAIGFSILIEFFNQVATRNSDRALARLPFRERTTLAIVNLMQRGGSAQNETLANELLAQEGFDQEERHMVEGVLTLAERSIKTIMTPRADIAWLNIRHSYADLMTQIKSDPHSMFPLCDGALENALGVVKAKDLIGLEQDHEALVALAQERAIFTVPETISVIKLMRDIKKDQASLVLVTDEFGVIQGLVTSHDIFEAIAGDFPDEGEEKLVVKTANGWIVNGTADLFAVERLLGIDDLFERNADYVTVAGLLLERFGRIPTVGDYIIEAGYRFTVTTLDRNRIASVTIQQEVPLQEQGVS